MSIAAFTLATSAAAQSIPYAHEHVIEAGDSPAVVAEKAAKVLPRANQVDWMRLERTFFLHFGVNTFNEVEWGSGREEPSIFNPSALDARQWLRAVKQLDGKMIVLVAKHHDGFSMWPTRYTAHSSAASPWRGGKGDLVREVAQAAKEAGVKLAVYLSPADLYQLRTNPKNPAGYYGNGSPKLKSTIPTDPASFKTRPRRGRAPTPGFGRFSYEVDDYNRYFLNQLYELLTEYGPIAEVWFDGANPDPSVEQRYDYAAWYDLIRSLQPNAVIMGKGPDVRWVGSESGYGRTTEWSVIPLPTAPERFDWPDWQGGDLGSRAQLKPGSHLWWYPAETNVTMLGNGQWFWARTKRPRPVPQLVDIFYASIGRNGNLILNLSPDNRGLVPDDQLSALAQMSEIVRKTFERNLAAGARLEADHAAKGHRAQAAADGRLRHLVGSGRGPHRRHAEARAAQARRPSTWSRCRRRSTGAGSASRPSRSRPGTAGSGCRCRRSRRTTTTTVGQRRLIRLAQPVTTDRVRVRITAARFAPTLAEVALYRQSLELMPPAIADRGPDGKVAITHASGGRIVYTTDGSTPAAAIARLHRAGVAAAQRHRQGRAGAGQRPPRRRRHAQLRRAVAARLEGRRGRQRRGDPGQQRRRARDRRRLVDLLAHPLGRGPEAAAPHHGGHGPGAPHRRLRVPAAPGRHAQRHRGALPLRGKRGRRELERRGRKGHVLKRPQQPRPPGSALRAGEGTVLPVHRAERGVGQRLDQRGRAVGDSGGPPVTKGAPT